MAARAPHALAVQIHLLRALQQQTVLALMVISISLLIRLNAYVKKFKL
jgi:hypothetical protein